MVFFSCHEKGEISGKQYGKQWVYLTRQDVLEAPTQEEISRMDNQIDDLKSLVESETVQVISYKVLILDKVFRNR